MMRVLAAFFFAVGLLVFLGGMTFGFTTNKSCYTGGLSTVDVDIEDLICQEEVTADMAMATWASVTGMLMLIFGGFMSVLLEIRDKSESTRKLVYDLDDGLRKRRSANEQRS